MRAILFELLKAIDDGRRVAFCRLVATRGSTPQKPGATMLVFENGEQAGTLGGGCVEAEVKRKAIASLSTGEATVEQFLLDSDYGWDDGLICGGRMQVMLLPLIDESARSYFQRLSDAYDKTGGIEAIEFAKPDVEDVAEDARGQGMESEPVPPCWLFDRSGQLLASLPAAAAEDASRIRQQLPEWQPSSRPSSSAEFVFLPIPEKCRLVIVGAGHVGQAVANLARQLSFDVVAVDDRAEYLNAERFPFARCVGGPIDQVLPQLEIDDSTYCLIVTRGHNHDQEALFHVIRRGARYVGMIGSRRKIKLIFENLLNEGIDRELLANVFAPVGLEIGSQTVPEIAVSIVAELIAHRNMHGAIPDRRRSVMEDIS